MVLAGVGVIYIILNQVYENTLYDKAISKGVDTTNHNYIDKAWEWLPIPVVLAILYGLMTTALRGTGSGVRIG